MDSKIPAEEHVNLTGGADFDSGDPDVIRLELGKKRKEKNQERTMTDVGGQVDGQPGEQQQPPVAVEGEQGHQPAASVGGQNQNPNVVDAAVLWQAVVDNINTMPHTLEQGDRLVETLADQLRRDAVVRERDGERQKWDRVVPLCDGGNDEALREWIKAVDNVPPEFRRDVASCTTRGALAGTVRTHIADVPAGGWDALRAVVAREYFSREYVTAVQQELQTIERRPH